MKFNIGKFMARKSILCVLLLLIANIGSLYAKSFTTADGYEFAITNGTVEITGYSGKATELIIPSSIEHQGKTYAVTSIGFVAFSRGGLISVTIPDSVTSIGARAFQYNYNLTSITIPNSVTSIGSWIFTGCTNLTSITIPSSVTSIGAAAFSIVSFDPFEPFYPNNLTHINVDSDNPVYTQINGVLFDKQKKLLHTFPGGKKDIAYIIPDGTVSIGWRAFKDSNLRSVTIPDSVTSIAESAFSDSSIDSSITISDSVTFIGENAFRDCFTPPIYVLRDSYAHRYAEQNAVPYSLIGEKRSANTVPTGMFKADGYLFVPTGKDAEIERYDGPDLELNIPSSLTYQGKTYRVTSIGDKAFIGSNLRSVTIPNTVTSIGERAFALCTSLISVSIPNSVISIGAYAFLESWNLSSVVIPDSVTRIGEKAFYTRHGGNIPVFVSPDSYTYRKGSFTDYYSLGTEESADGNYSFNIIEETVEIVRYNGSSRTVGIPSSIEHKGKIYRVTSIKHEFSFSYLPNSVTIPGSVTSMEGYFSSAEMYVSENSYAHRFAKEKDISFSLWPVIKETYRTIDNLRLRQNAGTAGTSLFTLPMGTSVKVLARGNVETIDNITANWVQVEVVEDTKSIQGDAVKSGVVGWCFAGYLGDL